MGSQRVRYDWGTEHMHTLVEKCRSTIKKKNRNYKEEQLKLENSIAEMKAELKAINIKLYIEE